MLIIFCDVQMWNTVFDSDQNDMPNVRHGAGSACFFIALPQYSKLPVAPGSTCIEHMESTSHIHDYSILFMQSSYIRMYVVLHKTGSFHGH